MFPDRELINKALPNGETVIPFGNNILEIVLPDRDTNKIEDSCICQIRRKTICLLELFNLFRARHLQHVLFRKTTLLIYTAYILFKILKFCCPIRCKNLMHELGFYVPFNSISVILGQWKGEHERLCAMKRRSGSERILENNFAPVLRRYYLKTYFCFI